MLMPPHIINNHTGDSISLWMDEERASFPPLDQDMRTDVCIISGGMVGLTCAYFLLQQGLSVAVIEGGEIGGGQSSRTTGHLAWVLEDRFFKLENLFGLNGAHIAAESHREAIKTIERIVKEERIQCDFEKLDAYLFLAPGDSSDILKKEWNTLQKIGMPVKKRERSPIVSFDTSPCLQFPDYAQFHIFKYFKGLISAILKRDGKIYAHTHAHDIEDGSPCYVVTNHHDTIMVVSPALEGVEVRFGSTASVLWSTSTSSTSNGSVNSMHDSLSPLTGGIAMFNIMVGEVIFGGVGVGLCGMLIFIVAALTFFPALSLGPIIEQFLMLRGNAF